MAGEGSVGGGRHGLLERTGGKKRALSIQQVKVMQSVCVCVCVFLLTEFFKQSSSTSKLDVSVGLLTSGM